LESAVAFQLKAALFVSLAATTCSNDGKQKPFGLGNQHRLPVAR